MPVLFSIFAQPNIKEKMRELLLVLLYMAIRTFTYADGSDNNLIKSCFDETFELWMAVFISALHSP